MINGQTGSYHRGPYSADKYTHWGFLWAAGRGDDTHTFKGNTYVCRMYIYIPMFLLYINLYAYTTCVFISYIQIYNVYTVFFSCSLMRLWRQNWFDDLVYSNLREVDVTPSRIQQKTILVLQLIVTLVTPLWFVLSVMFQMWRPWILIFWESQRHWKLQRWFWSLTSTSTRSNFNIMWFYKLWLVWRWSWWLWL